MTNVRVPGAAQRSGALQTRDRYELLAWNGPASAVRRFPPPLPSPASGGGKGGGAAPHPGDRKSTRLNSSHGYISYAVFCLKKKKKIQKIMTGGITNSHTHSRGG